MGTGIVACRGIQPKVNNLRGAKMEEVTLDDMLEVLGNPTRRRILEMLALEKHYPLQISKELKVSQQAVAKHLQVLERHNLVECKEESSPNGPPHKCYVTTQRFSLTVDLGPHLFNTEMQLLEEPKEARPTPEQRKLGKITKQKDVRKKLGQLAGFLREMNERIEELDHERASVVRLKEEALSEVEGILSSLYDDYYLRRLFYYVIDQDSLSLPLLSERMDMRERMVRELLDRLIADKVIEIEEV